MVFTEEHFTILASPEHCAGLGVDIGSLTLIIGQPSVDRVDHGTTYELAYITPTHFAVNRKGEVPLGPIEIAKNYPGLRPFLPIC